MVYEVISPRPHGSETFVGLHTEYPECIDPLSVQEAMLSGGNKIIFKGTEKEYEAVKKTGGQSQGDHHQRTESEERKIIW